MVQRKLAVKLGVQADHVKSEKRLGNLKPSSYQYQDGKNKGPDMKKKMKKSRSIQLSDIESFSSSTLRKTMSQPGKPLPLNALTTAPTPQKQQLMLRTTGGSPNYMKATSSSEARRERSQVSSLNTPNASDIKRNPGRRNSSNSKPCSASSSKATRTLTKSSSLKLVRTLTKTPSFKPARSAPKRCSRIALCADMNVQKATCSSTLKGSKFPEHLILNPGGTKAEGISVLKVCPYTYCSLNGHHHTLLPPLKYFLNAKRHSLKAQKSAKLEVLSLCRAKAFGDVRKEISCQPSIFSNEPVSEKADSVDLLKIPVVKEVDVDFFVEIYAKDTGICAAATEKHTEEDHMRIVCFAREPIERDSKCSSHRGEEEPEPDNMKQVDGNLSDASTNQENNFEEIYGQNNYTHPDEIRMREDFLEEKDDADGDYLTILSKESRNESFGSESHIEGECQKSKEEEDSFSEASDMQWDEGQYSTSGLDTEAHYLDKSDRQSCPAVECLSDIKKFNSTNEPGIIRSDNIISNCTEEILADEILQELFEEETASFDTHCINSGSETESMLQTWKIETTLVDGDSTYADQRSSIEYAFEEPITVEEKSEDADKDLTDAAIASASMKEPIVEPAAVNENIQENGVCDTEHHIFEKDSQLRDAENSCSTNLPTKALNYGQQDKSLEADDIIELLPSQIAYSRSLDEMGNAETNEGQMSRETETDQNLATSTSAIEEQEQVDNAELSMGIQISDSSQSSSEADHYDSKNDDNQTQIIAEARPLDKIAEDSSSSKELLDQIDPAKFGQNENQDLLGEHQGGGNKSNILTSMDIEEQSDSRTRQIRAARHHREVEKMKVEVYNQSGIAETKFAANDGTNAGPKSKFLHRESNSSQELASDLNNMKWTIRCKKPIMDLEEVLKFNPREPNFLPVAPDPEGDKVDLSHQIMDDRKNAEEWMLDYALRQAVTKLASARKRKVALLVEAFETVLPIPKYETQIRPASAAFSHTRPIQACS